MFGSLASSAHTYSVTYLSSLPSKLLVYAFLPLLIYLWNLVEKSSRKHFSFQIQIWSFLSLKRLKNWNRDCQDLDYFHLKSWFELDSEYFQESVPRIKLLFQLNLIIFACWADVSLLFIWCSWKLALLNDSGIPSLWDPKVKWDLLISFATFYVNLFHIMQKYLL